MRRPEMKWITREYDALYAYCRQMVKEGRPAGAFVR
jgi:hypothetical protein